MQYQSTSRIPDLAVIKRIQGGTKHDITLKLSNGHAWDVATLTLHPYGKPTELLPFRVETRLGSKDWVEYPTGCEIHAETRAHVYTSVRAQFCKWYYDQQIQFTMDVDGQTGCTSVPIIVKRFKRRHPIRQCLRRLGTYASFGELCVIVGTHTFSIFVMT